MDRTLVLDWLEGVGLGEMQADAAQDAQRLQTMLDACQSELERQVLRAIVETAMRLPDQAQRTVYDQNGAPVTIAYFFYEPRLIVFVDGSPHRHHQPFSPPGELVAAWALQHSLHPGGWA